MTTRRTFRPTGVIAVMWAVVVVLVVLIVAIGARLPQEYRFSTSQALTLWAFIGVVAVLALGCSLSRVTADEDTLEVVNAFRRRTFTWDEIAMISMRAGAPWPTMVTRDERRFILFAIQGSEGPGARRAVEWLAEHVR